MQQNFHLIAKRRGAKNKTRHATTVEWSSLKTSISAQSSYFNGVDGCSEYNAACRHKEPAKRTINGEPMPETQRGDDEAAAQENSDADHKSVKPGRHPTGVKKPMASLGDRYRFNRRPVFCNARQAE
jgi:hypothetical protein